MATASSPTSTATGRGRVDVVMRQEHRAGEKLFVDFPGEKIPIYDRRTGEVVLSAELFVAVAGASNYLYAEALRLPGALVLGDRPHPCLRVHGGLSRDRGLRQPAIWRHPAAPLRAGRECHLSGDGRPLRGRDHPDADLQAPRQGQGRGRRALAERWIIARLRHRRFTSLAEANAAIASAWACSTRGRSRVPGSPRSQYANVYLTEDVSEATVLLDKAITGCLADEVPEIVSLGHTLERWHDEILNHHRTGASNGPTEGQNFCVKKVKRAGRGFQCFKNYKIQTTPRRRSQLAKTTSPPRIRTHSPHSNVYTAIVL